MDDLLKEQTDILSEHLYKSNVIPTMENEIELLVGIIEDLLLCNEYPLREYRTNLEVMIKSAPNTNFRPQWVKWIRLLTILDRLIERKDKDNVRSN